MISMNSGLRDAPPTRKPSTSFWEASSLQVAPVTEPEKQHRCVRGESRAQITLRFCFSSIHKAHLRRWSSQSWPRPRTRCSSTTPSVCRELPEPEISHGEHVWNHTARPFVVKHSAISNIYLLWRGGLAGPNSPHRLISKHDLAPVLYVVCQRDKTLYFAIGISTHTHTHSLLHHSDQILKAAYLRWLWSGQTPPSPWCLPPSRPASRRCRRSR